MFAECPAPSVWQERKVGQHPKPGKSVWSAMGQEVRVAQLSQWLVVGEQTCTRV